MLLTVDPGGSDTPARTASSEAWLAAIFEATPDAIVAVASNGTIVTVNAQAERFFGYARGELIGRPVDMLLPNRLREAHAHHREDFVADPRVRQMGAGLDLVACRKDGREIPVEVSLSPLPTPDGLFVVSAIRDVTDRRLADQDRARLVAIVASTNDAIIGTTLDGTITSWNPAAERLYGYAAAEAIGETVALVTPPERAGEPAQYFARLQRGEAVDHVETVRVTKDGRQVDVALTISPVRARDGAVTGTATIARDITARKEAEAAFREVEERFRSAFDAAAIGMALVGLDGAFVQVNRSLCGILGHTEAELLGLTFQEITHPDDLEADLALVKQLLDGEVPNYSLEKRYFHKNGAIVWIMLSVTLVRNDAGDPLYFVSQIQDVTRAHEAERLKDEFVSTVSHELRTPLTSISGYVDLLLDGAGGDLSETTEHFLTIVQQNGRRLVALVNDLLDMSRIEAGQIGLRREEVDLAGQLHEVVSTFAPQVAAKQQTLLLELPESLAPIWADAQRSAQIFTNLISNANKYTPEGGTITVRVRPEANAVRVDVIDTGVGIPEDDQQQLFTRFFRAANRTTRLERGTGLGLAITRALVELHGGTISLRSVQDRGSTFSVTFPVRERHAVQAPFPDDGAPPLCDILVVEDDPDVGRLLREFLEQVGYTVSVVATAEDAVFSARTAPPSLITLDLRLADGDGWSVLERLRAAGLPVPPVVVVSILPESGYGRPIGVVDYLTKPVQGSILRERVANALANARDGKIPR
jgi:PAS domain S-box-containing protein